MITRFRVQNFKNLVDTGYVEFGPMNVIIGPNGCGKSSLLQAIDFLRAFFGSSVEVYLKDRGWEYRDLPSLRKTGKTITWEADMDVPSPESPALAGLYHYKVELSPRRYLGIGEETVDFTPAGGSETVALLQRKGRQVTLQSLSTEASEKTSLLSFPASAIAGLQTAAERTRYPELFRFREEIEGFRSFLFWDPKALRAMSKGKRQEIGPSGEDLAAVLAYLDANRQADFTRIVDRVKRLFPTVSDISVKGGKGWGWKELQLHEGDVVFNSRQISDGVLRLLAVLAIRYGGKLPPVLSLEEPENGIHPQLVHDVVALLRELTLRKSPSHCQVFFTTHSPYVLDEFFDHPEQVYIMERGRPQEGARLFRLSGRKDIDLARVLYQDSLGEAWFTGVIGGTSAARGRGA